MNSKAHAVCIPCPVQSHIKAMLKLAKLLHDKGIYITFVNTEYNHNRFLKSGGLSFLLGLPDFKFKTIPDGLPPSDGESTQDLGLLCESITVNFLTPFVNLVGNIESDPKISPVSCIVSDGFMGFTVDAGEQLGIPVVFLWTLSASAFMGFYQIQKVLDKGLIPLKDESCFTEEFLDTIVDWVPEEDFIRFRDLPSYVRTTNPDEVILKFTSDGPKKSTRVSANVLHTFRELEPSLIDFLSSELSRLYTVGPLELLSNKENNAVKSNGYSMWKEEPQCMDWLNSKKPNSVIYVNFGSIAVMPPQTLFEFVSGLANSGQNFLFIIRKDSVEGETGILPPEFFELTKERGFIASWCQQEEVLNHPAVGGFLTHGGWNSVIESLSAGVPMICLPFFGDQMTNCRYLSTQWEVGMELDGNFDKVGVEKVVRELMEGEKGEYMRKKAKEWQKMAIDACGKKGSSWSSFDMLVSNFFSHK